MHLFEGDYLDIEAFYDLEVSHVHTKKKNESHLTMFT